MLVGLGADPLKCRCFCLEGCNEDKICAPGAADYLSITSRGVQLFWLSIQLSRKNFCLTTQSHQNESISGILLPLTRLWTQIFEFLDKYHVYESLYVRIFSKAGRKMATPASYLFLTNELVALLTAEQKSNISQLADNLRLVTKIIYNRVKSQSFIESVQLLRLKKLFISFEILKLHRSVRFFFQS